MFTNPLVKWISGGISFIMENAVDMILLDGSILLSIILGLVFCCLGAIFDYGCVLQQQDDEML